jgi:suppressor for copper-sensitivity B
VPDDYLLGREIMKKQSLIFVLLCLLGAVRVSALQDDFGFNQDDPLSNSFPGLGNESLPTAEFEARFVIKEGTRSGDLSITGIPDILSHSHLYSQNKELKNQEPTEFKILQSDSIKLTGPFVPDLVPARVEKKVLDKIWVTEEFSTDVTWTAPFELNEGVKAESLELQIGIQGQVCNEGGCLPFDNRVVSAKFAGFVSAGPFRVKKGSTKVQWSGRIIPSTAKPGDELTVELKAVSDKKWNIYSVTPPSDPTHYNYTAIVFSKYGDLELGNLESSTEPESKQLGTITQLVHKNEITFRQSLIVPADAAEGVVGILGKIGFQTCDEAGICLAPTTIDFSVDVSIGKETGTGEKALTFSASATKYDSLAKIAQFASRPKATVAATEPFDLSNFLRYCGVAFLAGLILNIMPCVLPVIGLKMMSFVEQSGEDRGRIFALNMSFSLGLMTVFWGLATLVIVFGFGWGDLLNKGITGIIVASGVVFAFGLSMVGLWEIPIPGFASSSAANQLAEKEGLGGAFLKGVLTTILATPCVGPMLIPAMTFAVTQPQLVSFALFTVLGFGMAFPFVMVACFPGAIKLLPRPGAWMETFKQCMGFILIATVIFLLNTFSQEGEQVGYLLSVLTMLLSIGVGCWWIGRTSIAAEFNDKIKAYVVGIALITGGTVFAFSALAPSNYKLDWQPYSESELAILKNNDKPVFVDFTGPG